MISPLYKLSLSPLFRILPLLLLKPHSVLAGAILPVTLVQDGDYVYTANVPGCVKQDGPSVTANWSSKDGFAFCGVGWAVGTNRTINYNTTLSVSGTSYFSITGWTRNPYVEYNIIQGLSNYIAPSPPKGQVTCNNQPYDIILDTSSSSYGLAGLDGVEEYAVYYSRKRNGGFGWVMPGPVDMACHFRAWEAFGMGLGEHAFQLVGLEGYYSTLNGSVTLN